MSRNLSFARFGEECASRFLEEKGLHILQRNYRSGHQEIDIICRDSDLIVFVEVKTRSSTHYGFPETAVGKKKQRYLCKAAEQYCSSIEHMGEVRFDVVAVIKQADGSVEIEHFRDAFYPNLSS